MESRSRGQSSIMLLMWVGLCTFLTSQVSAQSLAKAPAQMPYYWKDAPGVNFTCNAGWSQRGRYCYKLFPVSQTFFDAQATCNRYGGYLAYIDLFNTSYWLGSLAANSTATDVWIGLNSREGLTMEWANQYWPTPLSYSLEDQPSGAPNNIFYGNWGPNQPSDVSATGVDTWCARMNLTLTGHYPWYLESCWRQLPFICQYGACVNGLQFRCNNFMCIDKTLQCNGRDDCGDASDETTCPNLPSQSCSQYISGQSPLAPTSLSFSSPNPYKALTACMWIIEAPITNTAYITFTSVATEDKYDLVDVYVGGNMISNSRYLLTLSGTPAAATIPTIYSNNNFLIVRLTSDEATQYSGFAAQWSTGIKCDILKNTGYSWAADPNPITFTNGVTEATCSANCLSMAACYSATFTTPSTCRLHAAIRLPAVDTLSNYWVKSCPGYTGNTILPILPVSTVNYATGSWQTVYPPFFALTPYLHMVRTWTITGSQSFSILSIQVFSSDLPNTDSIDIFDGDLAGPLYSIYNTNTGNYYTTTQSTARVVWNNAQPVVNRGFAFRYATGCNIDIVADYAEIRTPGYNGVTGNYPTLVNCMWTFTPVTGSRPYSIIFGGTGTPALGSSNAGTLMISNSSQATLYDSTQSNPSTSPITHILSGTTTLTFTSTYQTTDLGFLAYISLDCPDQPAPMLGFSDLAEQNPVTSYGTLFTQTFIECPTGYYIQEEEFGQCAATPNLTPANITCGMGGKWNYVRAPTCMPIYCGPPPTPANSLLTSATNYFFSNDSSGAPASIVTYVCNDGFTSSGGQTQTSTCQSSGLWSPLPIDCTPNQCQVLSLGSNLIANVTGVGSITNPATVPASNPGTIVTFSCPTGYDLSGPTQLVCLSTTALWNDITPVCLPKVCTLPSVSTGTAVIVISNTASASSQYYITYGGNNATYTCIGTYYLGPATAKTFTQTVSCLATGKLSASPIDCTAPSGTGTPNPPTSAAACATTTNPLGYTFPGTCNSAGSTSTSPTLGPGVCYCKCKSGYQGYDCSVLVSNCDTTAWPSASQYTLNGVQRTSFCLNGGSCAGTAVPQNQCNCSSATTGYNTAANTQLSASGSTGSRCEVATTNWCSKNPCINGKCTSFTNGYYCTCNYGWQGANCTTQINFCAFKPCRNDTSQKCTNATASSCSCTSSLWKGVGCQCKTYLCSPNPCLNNGVCSMPTANTYVCTCPAGYTGTNCQTLSACSSLQCSGTGKSGTCIAPGLAGASTAICQCSPGWGGDQCNRAGISWNFDVCFGETAGMMGLWPFKNNVTANQFSFAFWFKTSAAQEHFTAAQLTDASSMTNLALFNDDWFNNDTSLIGFNPYDGLWHLVVLTCDGTSGTVSAKLYFDSAGSTMDYSAICTNLLRTPLIQVSIGTGMEGGCMSLVVVWQNSFKIADVSNLYNARNGTYSTFTPPAATVIWDWNWGVYTYLYTKGVSRISGSSRGLSSPIPLYQAVFNTCPTSTTYPVIDPDYMTGPGVATPTWVNPTLSNVAVSSSLVYNRGPGAQYLNLGTYPVYYMAKDTWGRYAFCEFYQIVNYGLCDVDEVGTGVVIPFSMSAAQLQVQGYLVTAQTDECPTTPTVTAYNMPFPYFYTCWELGRYNVDNVYVAPTTPMCAVADAGASNPAQLSVTFGWTYILTSLYTPSLGSFFKTQITNYTLGLLPNHNNLLQDLGCTCPAPYSCSPCSASVTTSSDSSNHLTVSITLTGVSDPPQSVGGTANPTTNMVSLEDALRYEVFVSGLFTNPNLALFSQQVSGAKNIDANSFFVNSMAQCSAPDMAAVTTDTPPVNVCVDCSPGSYFNMTTNVCTNCPMYQNQSMANQTACVSCPSGFTTATVASEECFTICAAGSYYNLTSMQCEMCPFSWYQPQAGLSYCLPCPDGKSTTMTGAYNQSFCSNMCGAGSEPSAVDRSVCSPCKIGYYKSANMTGMCVQCWQDPNPAPGMPIGLATPGNGSISASNCTVATCPTGTIVNTNASIPLQCIPCPIGYYQPIATSLSSVQCLPCPANTTTTDMMSSNFTQCVPMCPSGFYVNASLNTSSTFKCLPCPVGTYKNNTYNSTYSIFATSCTPCEDDVTTGGVGSTDVSACNLVLCDAGMYAVAGVCQPCPSNLYQPMKGLQLQCVGTCPAGSYSLTTGNTDMSNCTYFNHSFLLAKIQFTIPWTNSYLDSTSAVYMNLTSRFITILNSQLTSRMSSAFIGPVVPLSVIRNGTTVVYAAVQVNSASLVKPVQVAQVALYQSISSAISDAGGFLVNKASLITPTPLPVNSSDLQSLQVAELVNGTDYFCPEGWTFDMTEANVTEPCVPCDIGYFQPTGVILGCMRCSAGYSTQTYASYGNEWDVCELVCPLGQEYNGTGPNAVCQPCKLGYYKDTVSAAQCTKCPYFVTTAQTGSTSVNQCLGACSAGMYSVWNATLKQPQCVQCPVNTYKVSTTLLSVNCTKCASGYFTLSTGSTDPSNCINICDSHNPTPYCQNGGNCTFNAKNGNGTCTCLSPYFGPNCQFQSNNCHPGQYNNASAGFCEDCPVSTYSNMNNSMSCTPCPGSSTTLQAASTSLYNCTYAPTQGLYVFIYKIKLTITWNQQYQNTTSSIYWTLKNNIETIMQNKWKVVLGSMFVSTYVTSFTRGSVIADMVLVTNNADLPAGFDPTAWLKNEVALGNGALKDSVSGLNYTADPSFNYPFTGLFDIGNNDYPDADKDLPAYLCAAGEYLDFDTLKCTPCEVGFYQPLGVLVSCQACSQNYSTQSTGSNGNEQDVCYLVCPPGQQPNQPGFSSKCVPCLSSYYKSTTSASVCTTCPSNTLAVQPSGLTTINDCRKTCGPGFYSYGNDSNVTAGVNCVACPQGQWKSDTSNAINCTACNPGNTTVGVGSAAATDCFDVCHSSSKTPYCANNAVCNITGNTPSCFCLPGFTGNRCQSGSGGGSGVGIGQAIQPWIIAICIIGAIIIIIVLSLIGWCCRRGKERKRKAAADKADKEIRDLREKQEQADLQAQEDIPSYPFGMMYPQEAMMLGSKRPPSMINTSSYDSSDNNGVRYFTWKA